MKQCVLHESVFLPVQVSQDLVNLTKCNRKQAAAPKAQWLGVSLISVFAQWQFLT